MSTRQAIIDSDHHMYWIGVEDWTRFNDDSTWGGLLLEPTPPRGGAFVFTKVHTGHVAVEVEYHTSRPTLELDDWEDADLLVVDCPLGDLWVIPIGGGDEAIEEIVPGPGTYTVCCSSRGRDAADDDESMDPPIEHYRFDVWPTEPGDTTRTLKQTSEFGSGTL